MNELIISLKWDQLESVLEFADRQQVRLGVPTILRMRTRLVLEECFSAAMASPGADGAKMRCSFPGPQTVLVQFRSTQPGFSPNWDDLRTLDGAPCTYGLKLALAEGACQIAVGQK